MEENLESKLIKITLKELQDLELYQILGEKLYNEVEEEIKNKIADPNYIIDSEIAVLLNRYIKDFLVYGVLLNIPTSLNYKFTNKGVKNITDANSTAIIGGEIENVKRYYRAKFDSYRLRLMVFVKTSCGVGNTSIAPYSTGWYLPNRVNAQKIVTARANKLGRRGF
ncbi:DUF6712 family protein [Sphingobacterium chungjuense]|uniref:DUF6712 family protein n=1 Tax=Sphingobacterium chungjuense TaxID=2675553 RepID=UPI00140E2B9F|nr:hypothetical protein [Sphingobacterium chungjuense]